ncbi:MAG: hypothetical protein LBL15_07190, partial [Oscillospiraceae bacterium]|nr:hypothetical protein [Oscillospiraceae bacterium]
MMENENNYTQFAGRRGGPSEQDVQASGRNAARPGGDAAPAAESQRNDAPRGGFALYTGSGVCDVCNAPLSGRKAYIVPNDVFYNSPKYREHYRQFQRNLTGMNIPDSAFAQIRAMDHSSGSAVCENCIHMFETPLSARPIGGYVPAPSPAAFPQAQGRFGGIPQSAAGQPVSGAQKQNAGGSQKKKLPKFVLPAAIAAAVIIVAVFGIVMLTREPAVDTEQLLKSGLAYLDDEHYFEALEQFRAVIDADPETSEAPYIGAADAYIG